MKRFIKYLVCSFLYAIIFLIPLTKAPLRIDKETTFFTDPLDANGIPDYLEILNSRQNSEVDVENNAAIDLLALFGSETVFRNDRELKNKTLARLGISSMPATPHSIIYPESADEEFRVLFSRLQKQPWSEEDYPQFNELIQKNTDALNFFADSVSKPQWFWPASLCESGFINYGSFNDSFIHYLMLSRSMLHFKHGRFDDGIQDIHSVIRYNNYLTETHCYLHALVATVSHMRVAENISYLITSSCKSYEDLNAIKHLLDQADNFADLYDAYFWEYCIKPIAFFIPHISRNFLKQRIRVFWLFEFNIDVLDINVAVEPFIQKANLFQKAFKEPTVYQRYNKLNDGLSELRSRTDEFIEPLKLMPRVIINTFLLPAAWGRQSWSEIAGVLINDLSATDSIFILAYEELKETFSLLRIALLLRQFHHHKGFFPDSLDELAKHIGHSLPLDRFADAPHSYNKTSTGFIIYSIGKNFTDNGGDNAYDVVIEFPRSDIQDS